MNDLTKDEAVKMAREAAARHGHTLKDIPEPATVEFITELVALCRAPLIAENAALKQAHEINADTLNAMQVEIDDWKARALKAEQAGKYICPVRTVADLVNNLKLMDQTLPIYGAQYIENLGKSRCIATPPTVSRERIKDSRWIGEGDTLNAAVIWTRAEQPPQPAAQEPTSAVPVVKQLVEALDGLFSGDVVVWSLGGSARPRAAIAAGQKFIKENGK